MTETYSPRSNHSNNSLAEDHTNDEARKGNSGMKQTFECVEKHLYRRQYQTASGDWRTLYYVIFTDWKKKRRTFPVGSDLRTAREECKVLEARNIRKENFDQKVELPPERLTIAKYLPVFLQPKRYEVLWLLEELRQSCPAGIRLYSFR